MKTRPFFSVIIATYNRECLLERALQSLVNQTEHDWEAVVIDDGSTDGTVDVVRKISQCVPGKLAYVKQDRKSTRLNSSHVSISYAVFCLKKKKKNVKTTKLIV